MNIASNPHMALADLYRRARALASEETAQPGQAAALYEATAALFDEAPAAGGPKGGDGTGLDDRRLETLRERIRRVATIALRRQALAARQAWVDQGGPAGGTDAQATALLAQALTFGEAALTLHRKGDAAREGTERLVAFLRSTLAIAQSPPKGTRAQAAAQPVSPPVASAPSDAAGAPPVEQLTEAAPVEAPPVTPPAPPEPARVESIPEAAVFVAGEPPTLAGRDAPARRRTGPDEDVASRRPALVPALVVIAVVGFVAGLVAAPRIWRGGASTRQDVHISHPAVLPSPPAAPRVRPAAGPAAAPAPGPTDRPVTAAPAPVAQATRKATPPPDAPRKVVLVLRSDPSGAEVFIGGVWQGATPLRLEHPPGTVLHLTVRRGRRVWRGTLRVGERSGEVLTVRIPEAGPVVARSTPPPSPSPAPATTSAPAATVVNTRAHFEGLMAQGVELYRGGWYGPAMARFRAASAMRPDAPSPYLWFARAAVRVGRIAEARAALEQVIAVAPASAAAREAEALLNRLK
ncbi:MAG: PEGA domain-containing protein [Armatimonadetes bacterium]|nr:PEGA domain-containing protein [Armatimonadota bacterium]